MSLTAGAELPAQTYVVTRADLVRYAGASLDFNPIHWNDRAAAKLGLPGVIAHGLYTMALVGRALTTWAGDPAAVREVSVRFTRPVVVPDDDTGVEVTVSGIVKAVTEDGDVQVDVTATSGGEKVLGQAKALLHRGVGSLAWGSGAATRTLVARGLIDPSSARPGTVRFAQNRGVAQLAAQRSPKPQVAGSSPVAPAPMGQTCVLHDRQDRSIAGRPA